MSIDELIEQAWNDHATDAAGVLERLRGGIARVTERRHLVPLANLVVHVGAEHLGRYGDTLGVLQALEALPAFDLSTPEGKAVRRFAAVVYRCAGDLAASERCMREGRNLAVPEGSERARLHAIASTTLLGQRRVSEARAELESALAAAAYGPPAADPAARSLAVSCNNMASELETRPGRSAEETALMVRCAEQALVWWKVAGGPTEEGRAEYRLANSLREAGRAADSLLHAQRCLSRFTAGWTQASPADPSDVLFAHEALARAQAALGQGAAARASLKAGAALLPSVADEGLRALCADELAKARAALGD